MQCRAFAGISLGKGGIEANTRSSIFQRVDGFVFGEVGGRTVRVEEVVGSIEVNGGRVVFNGKTRVFGLKGRISFGFELEREEDEVRFTP